MQKAKNLVKFGGGFGDSLIGKFDGKARRRAPSTPPSRRGAAPSPSPAPDGDTDQESKSPPVTQQAHNRTGWAPHAQRETWPKQGNNRKQPILKPGSYDSYDPDTGRAYGRGDVSGLDDSGPQQGGSDFRYSGGSSGLGVRHGVLL